MPRGRSPGYDDQREQILSHAARLFAQQGYPATSMNEVAESCGMSKPALYHYFRDKYALLVNIAAGHVSRLEAVVDEVDAEELRPEPRLRQLIQRFLREYASAQHAHRVLTEDVKFLEPEDLHRILSAERRVVAAFARAVAELRPELRQSGLAEPVTMLLFGMNSRTSTILPLELWARGELICPIAAQFAPRRRTSRRGLPPPGRGRRRRRVRAAGGSSVR